MQVSSSHPLEYEEISAMKAKQDGPLELASHEMVGQINLEELLRENASYKLEIETLRADLARVHESAEICTVEELKQQITLKDRENARIAEQLESLSHKYKKRTCELDSEAAEKRQLGYSLQQISQKNAQLEDELEKAIQRIDDISKQQAVEKTQLHMKEKVFNSVDFDAIAQMCRETPRDTEYAIRELCRASGVTANDKVIQIIGLLLEDKTQDRLDEIQSLREHNKQLSALVHSQLAFIQRASDGEIPVWSLCSDCDEEARSKMIEQCRKIHSYVLENNIENSDVGDVFDCFMIDSNPVHLKSMLLQFAEKSSSLRTQEEKELFTMLAQALTANDILRRQAMDAKAQCVKQDAELRHLRYHNNIKQREQALEEEWRSFSEKRDRITRLLANATRRGCDYEVLLNCLRDIGVTDPLADTYYDALEEKCVRLESGLERVQTENRLLVNDMNEQIAKIGKEMMDVVDQSTKQLSEKDESISKLKSQAIEKKKEICNLNAKIDQMESQYSELTERYAALEVQKQTEQDAMKQEYSSFAKELKKDMKTVEKEYNKSLRLTDNEIQRICASMKRKRAKMDKQLSEAQHQLAESQKQCKELIYSYEARIQQLETELTVAKSREAAALDEIESLRSEVAQYKERFSSLVIEHKVLTARFATREERMKREKSACESQAQCKIMSLQNEVQTRIDQCRGEFETKMNTFLSYVCHMFKDMFDIDFDSISQESVRLLLIKVNEHIRMLKDKARSAQEAVTEVLKIKQIVGAPVEASVVSAVADITGVMEQQKSDIAKLRKENAAIKKDLMRVKSGRTGDDLQGKLEWEKWAMKMHSVIAKNSKKIPSAQDLRQAIEEKILQKCESREKDCCNCQKKIECLQVQKKLLLSGAIRPERRRRPPSLGQLMAVVIGVMRMQKSSAAPNVALFGTFVIDEPKI